MTSTNSSGYGPPSNQWKNITFDGDETKFELWQVKFLGYMKIRKLKHVLVGEEEVSADDNENAFAELIQFLDERSISLIMREARDDGRKAFQLLRDHYAGTGKPRIIALYTQLTSLKKSESESITDYILRADTAANSLRTAGEIVSDGLLVAMVVKGLPDSYKAFIAVTTQSEHAVQDFAKFKIALKNFEDTERAYAPNEKSLNKDSIPKTRLEKLFVIFVGLLAINHQSAKSRKRTRNGVIYTNQRLIPMQPVVRNKNIRRT